MLSKFGPSAASKLAMLVATKLFDSNLFPALARLVSVLQREQ